MGRASIHREPWRGIKNIKSQDLALWVPIVTGMADDIGNMRMLHGGYADIEEQTSADGSPQGRVLIHILTRTHISNVTGSVINRDLLQAPK